MCLDERKMNARFSALNVNDRLIAYALMEDQVSTRLSHEFELFSFVRIMICDCTNVNRFYLFKIEPFLRLIIHKIEITLKNVRLDLINISTTELKIIEFELLQIN